MWDIFHDEKSHALKKKKYICLAFNHIFHEEFQNLHSHAF